MSKEEETGESILKAKCNFMLNLASLLGEPLESRVFCPLFHSHHHLSFLLQPSHFLLPCICLFLWISSFSPRASLSVCFFSPLFQFLPFFFLPCKISFLFHSFSFLFSILICHNLNTLPSMLYLQNFVFSILKLEAEEVDSLYFHPLRVTKKLEPNRQFIFSSSQNYKEIVTQTITVLNCVWDCRRSFFVCFGWFVFGGVRESGTLNKGSTNDLREC